MDSRFRENEGVRKNLFEENQNELYAVFIPTMAEEGGELRNGKLLMEKLKVLHLKDKKPAVDIHKHKGSAFYVRCYECTAKLGDSILTDFEKFSVYKTKIKPKKMTMLILGEFFYCKFIH